MSQRYARVTGSGQGLHAVDLFDSNRQPDLDVSACDAGTLIRYSDPVEPDGTPFTVLASPGSALALIWEALSDNGVDPSFPQAVQDEVQKITLSPEISDSALPDLSAIPFITIDNADSRDLDQAMHISSANHQFVLRYALADAAHFVRSGTALFQEALRRGASYYVPGFAVPMLPRVLSEDLISLNEGVLRRCLLYTSPSPRDS